MRQLLCLAFVALLAASGWAQRFDLVEPSGATNAYIDVLEGRLLVYERTGERILYSRDLRYDSPDGRFAGYFNFELQRILRFPRNGFGTLQMADLDDLVPHFENTVRIVRPSGGRGSAPAGRGLGGIGYSPGFIPPASSFGRNPPSIYPPVPYSNPSTSGFRRVPPLAQSVLLNSETVPNPPLEPVQVRLRNDGPRELQVGVVDLENSAGTRSFRIAAGNSVDVGMARDAGARRIQHYRVITPVGETITRETVTEIPPKVRYEIVVHEWQVQSVAIDRTAGADENPIEDINFQGRGIGRFPVPPGEQLQAGTIEVYRAARTRGNQGSVAPIVPSDNQQEMSPIDRAIFDAQNRRQ